MRGLFKRIADALSPTDRYPEETHPQLPSESAFGKEQQSGGMHNREDFTKIESDETLDLSLQSLDEQFRFGPIGMWRGWDEGPAIDTEVITFRGDHSGTTLVLGSDGEPEEQCIFEWQWLGNRMIQLRSVAWLTCVQEEGSDSQEWIDSDDVNDESEESDGPLQGEWETVQCEYSREGDSDNEVVILRCAGEEGFSCSCRYGDSPLTLDVEGMRESAEAARQASNQPGD